ncbi:MAG: TusE/DsrC/DsvC family sulfur relay protein [Hyphomicrobiaceae bacterium]|nr:TusE/DsrC/DsvC family sulfur relay protein [Hyphomicrobiaceae bacterium]
MREANDIMKAILDPTGQNERDDAFPNAPKGWTRDVAGKRAAEEGLELNDDHWEVIRVLQACYADEEDPPVRRLADALEARFSDKGGRRHLFQLFPGGPIAQGCRLASLVAPPGSVDISFGSVR